MIQVMSLVSQGKYMVIKLTVLIAILTVITPSGTASSIMEVKEDLLGYCKIPLA
jgi:hypothetical protein